MVLAHSVMLMFSMRLIADAVTNINTQRNNHKNISILLDNLLRGYDNSVRPNFGGAPAIVEVDIMIRSMGPISEIDMTYSMDCYFRQSWIDRRLAFANDEKDTLALSISMLARIWKPDTYFYNGKQSYLHTITTPNKFVRLYQDGRVLYSSRLTIKAGCLMNLEDFPMDIQRCPLRFGSFGYTTRDVVYRWNRARQIVTAEDMKLSQFDLIGTPTANYTDAITGGDTLSEASNNTEYSMLLVSFHLQRHMGNFLIQVYGPCMLLVVLSWVSFWLNREATADRVSLGITTVLTMTFLGLEARTDLPKVPYPTALDYFVFVSFTFIFATIIQFAMVHYFTKYGSGECYFNADLLYDSNSDEEEDCCSESRGAPTPMATSDTCQNELLVEVIPLTPCTLPKKSSNHATCWHCWMQKGHDTTAAPASKPTPSHGANERRYQEQTRRKKKKPVLRFNSVSKIDKFSRIVFPMLFLAINIFYWYSYLSRTKRVR